MCHIAYLSTVSFTPTQSALLFISSHTCLITCLFYLNLVTCPFHLHILFLHTCVLFPPTCLVTSHLFLVPSHLFLVPHVHLFLVPSHVSIFFLFPPQLSLVLHLILPHISLSSCLTPASLSSPSLTCVP